MRKIIISLLLTVSILFANSENSIKRESSYKYKGRAESANPTDSVAISMTTWGVGLAVGIALVFIFLKPSEG